MDKILSKPALLDGVDKKELTVLFSDMAESLSISAGAACLPTCWTPSW
jgi:hypothetical protein